MPSWPSAGGGREQDDWQAFIATGAGVPPPAGYCLRTEQLLQQQTDAPYVCEGEVLLWDCTTSTAPYRRLEVFALSGQFFFTPTSIICICE